MQIKKYVLEVSSMIDKLRLSYLDRQKIISLLIKNSTTDLMYDLYEMEDE